MEDDEQDLDEHGVKLHRLLAESDRFTYEYDFGDFWVHDIEVESVENVVVTLRRAVCIDGARARPPRTVVEPRGSRTSWRSWLIPVTKSTTR